jgi:serine/threonine protein kinase
MVYDLFTRALALPAADRDAFLRARCNDASILTQVLALLATDASDDGLTLSPEFAKESDLYVQQGPLNIGDRVAVFQITAELGRGGMGTVYKAIRVDGGFEQTVAIKVIFPAIYALFDTHKLANEANFMAKLNHDNICTVHDAGITDEGLHYVVMEYIDGLSVLEYAQKHQLSLKQRLRLFMSICDAVQFAHQHQVIHADIKPQNILVDGLGQPRILDFGIAKLFTVDSPDVTHYYQAFSADYASPELIANGQVTTLSDVYALGHLLAVLVNTPETRAKDKFNHYRRELQAISEKATQPKPEDRYQAVTELVMDVSLFLKGFVTVVFPATPWYRFKKFALLRHPIVSAVTGLCLVIVSALAVQLYHNQLELRQQHQQQILISERLSNFLGMLNPLQSNNKTLNAKDMLDNIYQSLSKDTALSNESKTKIILALADAYQGLDDISLSEQLYLEVVNTQDSYHNDDVFYQAATALSSLYNKNHLAETVIRTFSKLAQPFIDKPPKTLNQALFYKEYLIARSYVEDAHYAGPALSQRKTLLNDILSEFKSDLSANDRVMMQFELAKIYFNELPSDAFHSYFQVPAEQFENKHKPQLLLAKAMLNQALLDADKLNVVSLRARILSQQALINAELGLNNEAQKNLDSAEKTLEKIVDDNHSEMIQYHLTVMKVNYYIAPQTAINALHKIIYILKKQQVVHVEYLIIYLNYLHYMLLQSGEYQQAKVILDEVVELYLEQISTDNNFFNTNTIIGMLFNANEIKESIYRNSDLDREILKKLQSSQNLTGEFYIENVNYRTVIDADIKKPEQYFAWRANYIVNWKGAIDSPFSNFFARLGHLKLIWIESFTASATNSQQVLTALNAFTWSEQENLYSTYKVDALLTSAETLVHINDFNNAQTLLLQTQKMLTDIPLTADNAWQARLLMVQGELAFKQNNTERANELLIQAKPLVTKQFPADSLYNGHLQDLLRLVNQAL